MLRDHEKASTDADLERFKLAVARELAPYSSGFLIDKEHVERVAPFVDHGLILAVDRLVQEPGGVVEDTSLEEDVEPGPGVVALKLLVIWRDDRRRAERLDMSRRFAELARDRGLLSVLEPVVRVSEEEREDAVVEAARELGGVRPSLYKCQVPLYGRGDAEEIQEHAERIDAALPVPWVVLSQGVEPDDFPRAVEASCKGGASGMLAGRAVWTATLAADDPTQLLRELSVPRLQQLASIVDAHGRPWREKGGT
jgi:sulfofructosephosphate aldolase